MDFTRHTRLTLTLMVLLACSPIGLFAAKDSIGKVNVSGSAAEWQVTAVGHESVVLTVVGPGDFTYTKEFPAGKSPSFRIQDNPSKNPDGVYTYELTLVPRISPSVRKALAQAHATDAGEAEVTRLLSEAGIASSVVQSGVLTVINGSFVSTTMVESKSTSTGTASGVGGTATSGVANPSANMQLQTGKIRADDQVIADDLIVQGSTCVGLDCVVNESFGFDTIRLKENNTRITFMDTSTSAGFPSDDWTLTANDSASGGANKFSIDDITTGTTPFTVIGGAPTNSLFVSNSGRVGIRTASPVLDLHVKTGNTPAYRMEQDNSGGFTAQTWDIGANEANWFVRDVTGGSRLPLRIRPGAPTSSIDIAADGSVGIGTASPSTDLHIKKSESGTYTEAAIENTNSNGYARLQLTAGDGTTSAGFVQVNWFANKTGGRQWTAGMLGSNTWQLFDATASRATVAVDSSGNVGFGGLTTMTSPIQHQNGASLSVGGQWLNASSRALKQDIADLSTSEAMCALEDLKPVKYAYKADPDEHHVGFIAEDVPDVVATKDRKSLSSLDIVAVLTKVVQEQQRTIDDLSRRLESLEKH